jgi:restriction system protein
MSMPKFHQTMLPILKVLAHGNEQKTGDLPDQILKQGLIHLTDEELAEKTKSGDSRFHDRVWWGGTYLKQGKFIERPARGTIKITQKGLDYLKTNPQEMTLQWLKQDEDYTSYVPQRSKNSVKAEADTEDLSPDDLIEKGFADLEESLKKELLDKLHESNPYYFEKLVLKLFKKMGYGDFEETSKSRDGGIDGIINQDQLGIERIYIQAKRYAIENRVREPEIRNFIGAMSGDVSKGIFVTTSFFDAAAVKKAKDARNHKIILIDGDELVSLMIKYNIGVQTRTVYEVKEVDEDFFEIG